MKGILGSSVALLVALFLAHETLAQGEDKGHKWRTDAGRICGGS